MLGKSLFHTIVWNWSRIFSQPSKMGKTLTFVAAIMIAAFIGSINGDKDSNYLSAYIEKNEGLYLAVADKVLGSYLIVSPELCGLKCIKEPSCLSFNAAVDKIDNGMILCEMLSTTKYEYSERLQPSKMFHHYSIFVSFIYFCTQHKMANSSVI